MTVTAAGRPRDPALRAVYDSLLVVRPDPSRRDGGELWRAYRDGWHGRRCRGKPGTTQSVAHAAGASARQQDQRSGWR